MKNIILKGFAVFEKFPRYSSFSSLVTSVTFEVRVEGDGVVASGVIR